MSTAAMGVGVFCEQCGKYHASVTVCPNWRALTGTNVAVAANESTPQGLRMTSPEAPNLILVAVNELAKVVQRIEGRLIGLAERLARFEEEQSERLGELGKAVARIDGKIDSWSQDPKPPEAYWETPLGRVVFVSEEDRNKAAKFLRRCTAESYKEGKAEHKKRKKR